MKELRERLRIAAFDPSAPRIATVSVDEAAKRLGISVISVYRLIHSGALPASQLMPSAPWQVPVAALETEPVRIGVQQIIARRPRKAAKPQDTHTLRLPGV